MDSIVWIPRWFRCVKTSILHKCPFELAINADCNFVRYSIITNPTCNLHANSAVVIFNHCTFRISIWKQHFISSFHDWIIQVINLRHCNLWAMGSWEHRHFFALSFLIVSLSWDGIMWYNVTQESRNPIGQLRVVTCHALKVLVNVISSLWVCNARGS